MVVEQYSWKPLSDGHEENTQMWMFVLIVFFFFFFFNTCIPEVHYSGFTDNLLSTCTCVWVQCCVGYDRAWVFVYVCCARTSEREWTTECWCLCLVGKVHLFNSHLHICVYGVGEQGKKKTQQQSDQKILVYADKCSIAYCLHSVFLDICLGKCYIK